MIRKLVIQPAIASKLKPTVTAMHSSESFFIVDSEWISSLINILHSPEGSPATGSVSEVL